MYWVDIKLAQKKGLKFYQTRSKAIVLCDTLPAYCIPKAIMMGTGEIIFEKVYSSPRLPPKMSLRIHWMNELGSRSCSTSRRLSTNPNETLIQFVEQGDLLWQNKRPVRLLRKSIHVSLLTASTNLYVERLEKDKDTDKDVDADRDRMGRPVGGHWSLQLEEIDIDFRVSGWPHAVVQQAENYRVRQLVKKIESHPHRQDLQADLQQSNAYNPFTQKTKEDDSRYGQCRAIWVMRDNS